LAAYHSNLGAALWDAKQAAVAEAEWRTAVQLDKRLVAEHPGRPNYRRALYGSHNNLANALQQANKPAEAEAEYRQALDLAAQLTASTAARRSRAV
jgi:hypothetical protein